MNSNSIQHDTLLFIERIQVLTEPWNNSQKYFFLLKDTWMKQSTYWYWKTKIILTMSYFGYNRIYRKQKKNHQIEIFLSAIFWVFIRNTRTAITSSIPLIIKYRLLIESCELCESRILQIQGWKSFIKCPWLRKKNKWKILHVMYHWHMDQGKPNDE